MNSKLHGDALNKDKRNSQNAWIPTNHWVGGFLWHYIQRANRENFLYDLRCIDGESMQYTRYGEGQFYGYNVGLATQYKPVSVGNRQDGLAQDFMNENVEMVRKLSFAMQLSDLMIMRVVMCNCWMKQVTLTLSHGRRDVLFHSSPCSHRV